MPELQVAGCRARAIELVGILSEEAEESDSP